MRAARPERLPGGAAGASLALHLGAGLWLALGAMPGGPPAREAAREVPVAFAMLAVTAPGEAEEPQGLPELEAPASAEVAAEPEPPLAEAAPLPEPPPLAEAAPAPIAAQQPLPAPEPMAEAMPEPFPEPEALAEASPAQEPRPAPETPPARAEAPRPQPVAAPRPPRPAARPMAAVGRGVPREAAVPAEPAAAIPVAAAAPNPGPPPLITQARYRHPPTPPAYPPRAIALRMAGTALIRALVGPDGMTREVRLHRSSGFAELDNAALAAVRGWAFAAATEGGRPIEAWVEVPVRFRLDD
jgi:protein TonB